jgi:hypothetical protein
MPGQVTRRRPNRWRGLALLASALIVASACGSSTPTPVPGEATAPVSNAEPTAVAGESPGNLPPSPALPAGPPLSETLIAAALAAGTITYEQSLLYRALALYDSPGLPEAFRSPVPDMGAATALLGEISQKEAELSPALLEKLAPYRARPADPISIFNQPPGQGSLGIVYAVATPAPTTPAPAWMSQLVAGTGARVWVKASPDADAQLTAFADVVAKVWEQLPAVFRYGNPDEPGDPDLSVNPDDAIDIYFVETGTIDTRREPCVADPGDPDCVFSGARGYAAPARPFVGTTSSGYVVVDAGLPDVQLPDTTAHELTHVGQNAYDWNESEWLAESTATWAAYRVMKKLNLLPAREYGRLTEANFFAELDLPLAAPAEHSASHSYASWLFFLFASMEAGDAIVTKVWEAAAAEGVQSEKAVDQAFPFDTHFADFAVRNWNQDPVTPQYRDADATFPTGLKPKIELRGPTVMTGAGESPLNQGVPPLSSLYFAYTFEDAVRRVTFENAFAGVAHAHVWAIKKIGATWAEPEDWTRSAKKEFCRDVTDQNLTELVIIVSDSDMQTMVSAPDTRVVAETTGCVGWVGEIRGEGSYSWDINLNIDALETSIAQVHFIPNPWGAGGDPEFVLGSATVTWTSQWIHPPAFRPGNPPQPCPTTVFSGSYEAVPYDKATQDGDGELEFQPPPEAAPTPGPGSTQYALRQYEAGGLSRVPWTDECESHEGVSGLWWNLQREALATASADGRTLEGTWSVPQTFPSVETYTWKLQYVGPP